MIIKYTRTLLALSFATLVSCTPAQQQKAQDAADAAREVLDNKDAICAVVEELVERAPKKYEDAKGKCALVTATAEDVLNAVAPRE